MVTRYHNVIAVIPLLFSNFARGDCAKDEGYFGFMDYGVSSVFNEPPRTLMLINPSEETVTVSGHGLFAEDCSEDEAVTCFRTEIFTFSVLNKPEVGQKWTAGGTRFEVVAEEKLFALGRVEEVFRIESSTRKDVDATFYFNEVHGLRVIVLPSPYAGTASAYLATDEYGPFRVCK